jgi:hypothetical protein
MKNNENGNNGTDPEKASALLAGAGVVAVGTAAALGCLPLLLIGFGGLLVSGMIHPSNGEHGPDSHGG